MQRVEHDQWKSSEVARLLALVEAERRYYQEIFAVLPVAVAAVDDQSRLTAFNREFCRLLALEQADLAGLQLTELIADPALETALEEVRRSGIPQPDCPVRFSATGKELRLGISIQGSPGWPAGQGSELLLTLQERPSGPAVQIQSELIERHKRAAVERLSGRVAHLANNLLMIIAGYSEDLASTMAEDDPRRADIGEILRAANRMAVLTHGLNSLTRPPAVSAEDFDALPWLQSQATQLGLAAKLDPAVPLVVCCSPAQLEQALRATHRYLLPHAPGGRIGLAARLVDGKTVEISMSLEGAELSDEAAETIFEPFSGAKDVADPPLGLAGLIRPLESLGCTVRLVGKSAVQIRCPQGAARLPAKPKGRILLLEDEAGIRSLMIKTLEREGFAVTQASSTTDALAACRLESQRPDLIVTDIQMPGLPGQSLAAAIRAEYPAIKVLFVSGSTGDDVLDRQIGHDDLPPGTGFLEKPFAAAELLSEVHGLINRTN